MTVDTPSFFYAALLGLLLIVLSVRVVLARWRFNVRLGVGTEDAMQQSVRVQANFTEYVPLAVVLLVLAEVTGLPLAAVHAAGILLLASRLIHAWGLSRHPGRTFGRFYGTAGTWLVIAGLSLWLLVAVTGFSRSPAPA
ncbi:MAG: MAPEG family protein [Steroidobacteraceae bacterium]